MPTVHATELDSASAPVARPRVRVVRRPVHGVLLLDKPLGLSSNDALQKAKWLLRAEKAGHTGTLDPMATGLLPLCFGAATKFSQVSLEADKRYEAVVQLGVRTDTGDAEGSVLERRPVRHTQRDLEAAVQALSGEIEQIPPMHSALKKDGRALYEYARQGLVVERDARRVMIHELRVVPDPESESRLRASIRCSKGTYIRTLAEDLGEHLGCGGSLVALRRTDSGGLQVAQAVSLQALEAMSEAQRLSCLLPVDALLSHWPAVHLTESDASRFLSGMRRTIPGGPTGAASEASSEPSQGATRVRVYGPESDRPVLLGSARLIGRELIPERLLSPVEIQAIGEFSGT